MASQLSTQSVLSSGQVGFQMMAVPEIPSQPVARYDHPDTYQLSEHPLILSDLNMAYFAQWSINIPVEHIKAWMQKLYIYDHFSPSFAGIEQVRPSFGPDGHRFHVTVIACRIEGCPRCSSGQGGYKFNISGPWTPSSIFTGIGETPNMARARHHRDCSSPASSFPGVAAVARINTPTAGVQEFIFPRSPSQPSEGASASSGKLSKKERSRAKRGI